MANLNKVFLIGRLTRDPELKVTEGGREMARFGLAVNRRYTVGGENGQRETREETTFVDLVAWGPQARTINDYLRKGRQVFIEGRLNLNEWTDRDGQKRSKLRVIVDHFEFLGARGEDDRGPARPEEEPAPDGEPGELPPADGAPF